VSTRQLGKEEGYFIEKFKRIATEHGQDTAEQLPERN